jgi:hypothetical protein
MGFKDNLSALLKPPGVGNSKLTAQTTHQLLSNFQKVKKGLIYVMVDSTPVISTFVAATQYKRSYQLLL